MAETKAEMRSMRGLALMVCVAGVALASPAHAKTLRLTCTDTATKAKYDFTFDTERKTLATTHRDFTQPLRVEKVQEDEDRLLVWGAMPLGPSTKNVLVQFGKEKWVTHFSGYDEKRKDSCI